MGLLDNIGKKPAKKVVVEREADAFASSSSTVDELPQLLEKATFGGNPDQPYRKTARLHAIVNVGLALALVAALAGNVFLALNQPMEVIVLEWKPEAERWVTIKRPEQASAGLEFYTERAVEEYVLLRESMLPDRDEMIRRWGPDGDLFLGSSDTVYAAFRQAEAYWNVLADHIKNGRRRSVRIINTIKVGPWRYQVDFITADLESNGQELLRTNWRAIVGVGYHDQRVKDQFRHVNPFGFTVVYYSRDRHRA